MASINATVTGTTVSVNVGDNTAAAAISAAAAATSASAASTAAADAEAAADALGGALPEVIRLGDVYENLLPGTFDGVAVQTGASFRNVTQSRTDVIAGAFTAGTDLVAGQIIDRIVFPLAGVTTTETVRLRVYRKLTADADINTLTACIAGSPLVTVETTPAALGLTLSDSSTAPVDCTFDLDEGILVQSGYSYFVRVDLRNASDAQVALGYTFITETGAAVHRRGGYNGGVTSESSNTRIIASLYQKAVVDAVTLESEVADLKATTSAFTSSPASAAIDVIGRTLAHNIAAVDLQAARQTVTAANGTVAWGDSITAGSGGATSWVAMLASYLTSSAGAGLDNEGAGGETSTQVTTRVSAASAAQKAAFNYFMFGTNKESTVNDVPLVLANYATCVGTLAHTNYLCVAPILPNNSTTLIKHQHRLARQLIDVYGARAIDLPTVLRYAHRANQDRTPMIMGATGTATFQDDKHPTTAGNLILAQHFARAQRAILGGSPYVHHDTLAWNSGMAVGAVIGTPRFLGTCADWQIIDGNPDDLVRINHATGQITRGAGANLPAIRQITVMGRGAAGSGPGALAIITLVRTAETAQPVFPVRLNPYNVSGLYGALTRPKGQTEAQAFVANNASVSIVIRHQFTDLGSTGNHGAGLSGFMQRSSLGRMRFQVPGAPSGVLADTTLPSPADALGVNWFFFSFNGATGAWTSATNATSASGTGTAGTVRLSALEGLFNSGDFSNSPFLGNHYMTWIAAGSAIDWTSATERERFYDPATFEPQTLAADGTVNSVAPFLYVRGRAGDYLTAPNKAPAGLQLYAPPPLSAFETLFEDVV